MAAREGDFSPQTKLIIWQRVAGICSAPNCNVFNFAPKKRGGVNNTGKAAHICAAQPGGPRWDASMTREQRKAQENGIWLCAICADKIDRDPDRYPPELLQQWKAEAEHRAIERQGKPVLTEKDVLDTVGIALTGEGKPKTRANAIKNIHLATERAYESIDPRFKVISGRVDGVNTMKLNAVEMVPLTFKFYGRPSELSVPYESLINEGKPLAIPADNFTVEGSPLIEELINGKKGVINLIPSSVSGVVKLWLEKDGTSEREYFDDFRGSFSRGLEAITFEGNTYSDILGLSLTAGVNHAGNPSEIVPSSVTISLDQSQWIGKDIRRLQYLSKLRSHYQKIIAGWIVYIGLEYNGEPLLVASLDAFKSDPWPTRIYHHFNFIYLCATIARYFDRMILLPENVIRTPKSYQEVERIAHIIEGKRDSNDQSLHITSVITFSRDGNPLSLVEGKTGSYSWYSDGPLELAILGQEVTIPVVKVRLDNAILKVRNVEEETEDTITYFVEFVAGDGFHYSEAFDSHEDCFPSILTRE